MISEYLDCADPTVPYGALGRKQMGHQGSCHASQLFDTLKAKLSGITKSWLGHLTRSDKEIEGQ